MDPIGLLGSVTPSLHKQSAPGGSGCSYTCRRCSGRGVTDRGIRLGHLSISYTPTEVRGGETYMGLEWCVRMDMYVCVCVCVCVCMYVCMCVYVCKVVCKVVCMYVCMYVRM